MSQQDDERALAETLITTGRMTREELAECLEAQRQAGGPAQKPLSQVVVDQGHITFNELATVLIPQPQQTLWCPRCQLQFNAQGAVPGARYACQQCHGELQPVLAPSSDAMHQTRPAAAAASDTGEEVSDEKQRAVADPSRRIGRYAVLEELGRGGMGVVYRCYDPQLHRHVAIKMILDTNHADSNHLARFEREARAVAKLQHPGIVALHEVGESEGHPYLVMDFVEGTSLDIMVKRDEPSSRRLAELIRDVALALDHAHDTGIIHRDIKPQNVIVDPDGKPHIMDFGLARDSSAHQQLTQTGQIMGTPAYMAPEQANADVKSHGPWTDIYALGAMMYEAFTGQVVFESPNQAALLKQILLNDPQPLRRHAPTISPDLETITLKCLEKEPDRRYPSTMAVAEELQRFIDGKPILARPLGRGEKASRWLRRNRGLSAALAVAALVAVGATVLLVGQSIKATQEQNRLQLAAKEEATQLKQQAEKETSQLRQDAEREAVRREERARLEAEMAAKEREQRVREEAVTQQREKLAAEALSKLREEVKQVLDRVRSGELLRNQSDGAIAKAKLLKYHEPETVLLLTAELDRLSRQLAESHSLTPEQELFLGFLCNALWNLGIREQAVESLGRYLQTESSLPVNAKNQLRAVPAGKALCFLGGGLADRHLQDAKLRFGIGKAFWLQVGPLFHLTGSNPELQDETARGYVNRGANRSNKGDLDGAFADYSKAIELDPSYALSWQNRGNIRSRKGDYAEAIADYSRAIELDPHNASAWKSRGTTKANMADIDGAIADLTRAIEINPTFTNAWIFRGESRHNAGDHDGAIADFEHAIELDPTLTKAWAGLGTTQMTTGHLDDAFASFTHALKLNPNYSPAWSNRGFVRRKKGDFAGALVDYSRALEIQPGHAGILSGRALARLKQGDFNGAISDCSQAIATNPNLPSAWLTRGNSRFQQGDLDRAISDFNQAIDLEPSNAHYWLQRGAALYGKGDINSAISDFDRSIDLDPSLAPAWYYRSMARADKGDIMGAARDGRRARDLDPTLETTKHELGIRSKKPTDLDEAMAGYDRDTDIDPNDAAAWTNRGIVRQAKGDIDGAIEDYNRAIEADPTYAAAWARRMGAQVKKGDVDDAITDMEGFLEAVPDHPKIDTLRAALEHIRKMQAKNRDGLDK